MQLTEISFRAKNLVLARLFVEYKNHIIYFKIIVIYLVVLQLQYCTYSSTLVRISKVLLGLAAAVMQCSAHLFCVVSRLILSAVLPISHWVVAIIFTAVGKKNENFSRTNKRNIFRYCINKMTSQYSTKNWDKFQAVYSYDR